MLDKNNLNNAYKMDYEEIKEIDYSYLPYEFNPMSRSVSIFIWEPKVNGKQLKKGRHVCRVVFRVGYYNTKQIKKILNAMILLMEAGLLKIKKWYYVK